MSDKVPVPNVEPASPKLIQITKEQLDLLLAENKQLKLDLGASIGIFKTVIDTVTETGISKGEDPEEMGAMEKTLFYTKLAKKLPAIIKKFKQLFAPDGEISKTAKDIMDRHLIGSANGEE